MAVNRTNEESLRLAMKSVIAKAPQEGPGFLTWNNVCAEAGVPRATAARAKGLIGEWKTLVAAMKAEMELGLKKGSHAVDVEKIERDDATIRELRETIRTMANHIQAMSIALDQKDTLIATLESQGNGRKVVVMAVKS